VAKSLSIANSYLERRYIAAKLGSQREKRLGMVGRFSALEQARASPHSSRRRIQQILRNVPTGEQIRVCSRFPCKLAVSRHPVFCQRRSKMTARSCKHLTLPTPHATRTLPRDKILIVAASFTFLSSLARVLSSMVKLVGGVPFRRVPCKCEMEPLVAISTTQRQRQPWLPMSYATVSESCDLFTSR
jgi:hypothetical protein